MTPERGAWPQTTPDGQARATALGARVPGVQATALIEYRSGGHLLVIGSREATRAVLPALQDSLTPYLLIPRRDDTPGPAYERELVAEPGPVSGHLGAFVASVAGPGGEVDLASLMRGAGQKTFDLVLDLRSPPALDADVLPAGYYAPGADPARLAEALEELAELVGEFEKPRYFDYDPAICAHSRSGQAGCRRCLDACPTDAIRSAGDRIEVDPYLCQGGGTCATACPSGAITYAYPTAADMLDYLRGLLQLFHDAGGRHPVLVFCDRERGAAVLAAAAGELPEHVLAVEVEEIGAVGLDVWLTALAFGAAEVLLLTPSWTAPTVSAELRRQLDYCGAILAGLGLEAPRVRALEADATPALTALLGATRRESVCRSPFATFGEKRNTVFTALERLAAGGAVPQPADLPEGAPFGTLEVDRDACTLCLACASLCPVKALQGGTDTPLLAFIEGNCVQCGLCRGGCPESAISLRPRMLFDAEARRTPRVLNEEPPFECADCGKPFATRKIIETMRRKLSGHRMFSDAAALRRLELCEDCRVKDLFRAGDGRDPLQ